LTKSATPVTVTAVLS